MKFKSGSFQMDTNDVDATLYSAWMTYTRPDGKTDPEPREVVVLGSNDTHYLLMSKPHNLICVVHASKENYKLFGSKELARQSMRNRK